MRVYLVDENINKELKVYLETKYTLSRNITDAEVIVIYRVKNIRLGLDIVDYALSFGKEIICIKSSYTKGMYYLSSYLIRDGATFV